MSAPASGGPGSAGGRGAETWLHRKRL